MLNSHCCNLLKEFMNPHLIWHRRTDNFVAIFFQIPTASSSLWLHLILSQNEKFGEVNIEVLRHSRHFPMYSFGLSAIRIFQRAEYVDCPFLMSYEMTWFLTYLSFIQQSRMEALSPKNFCSFHYGNITGCLEVPNSHSPLILGKDNFFPEYAWLPAVRYKIIGKFYDCLLWRKVGYLE